MTKTDNLRLVPPIEPGVAPSLPPPDKLIGRTIDGRYVVEAVLGEGGMGLVYRAHHATLKKPLAIKVLKPDVSKDDEVIRRFRQEAQAATAIGNQHIIDIIDFGTLPDASTYFVMEYLDGQDLTRTVANAGRLPIGQVIHVSRQLCRALGAAHEAGIVHRDLKPDNIFLVKRGDDTQFVKVLDFGIAKVGGQGRRLTQTGQVFGTPHYMAPEQCAGAQTDARTDIYALGVIMYEMATGRVPFNAETIMGVLTMQMYEAPAPLSAVEGASDMDPEFEAVVLRCLVKDPEGRYQSMADLLQDLDRLSVGEAPAAALHPVPEFAPFPLSDARGKLRRRIGPKQAAIAAVVTALGIVGVVLLQSGASETPSAAPALPQPKPAPVVAPEVAAPPPAPKTVQVVSTPEGVEVLDEGNRVLGVTPFALPLDSNKERRLTFRLTGYQDVVKALAPDYASAELRVQLPKSRPVVKTTAGTKPPGAGKRSTQGSPQRNREGLLDPWAE